MGKLFSILTGAVRKLWGLLKILIVIWTVAFIALFFVTVFFRDDVVHAFEVLGNIMGVSNGS